MFTTAERERVRESLLRRAREDAEISGAALVGSGATGREDSWSDIDLALRVVPTAVPGDVAEHWTVALYDTYEVAHHLDLIAGGVLYRVFLLASSLQVDISFWPYDAFRATEPGFTLVFGTANAPTSAAPLDADHLAGLGWLYGLHARSAIARGRRWQAVLMLDGLRDQLVALACLRYGYNPHHGRQVDELPATMLDRLAAARPRSSDDDELRRANEAAVGTLIEEIAQHDHALAQRLAAPAEILARP